MIGILAGNHQIFRDVVRKLQLKNTECVYVHDPMYFAAGFFDRVIVTCGFWKREDAEELYDATVIRLRPSARTEHIPCCEGYHVKREA